MKITEHFDSSEFKQPARKGFEERPYPEEWVQDRLVPLCTQLELIREKLGNYPIKVISGYRSPEYNSAIGGAKQSQHMQGRAADIIIKELDAITVYNKILLLVKAKESEIGGLGRYDDFTHVDIRESPRLMTWNGSRTSEQTEANA